ncbi:hypothetical protein, partial [Amycolatopsis sp. cmx-11-32]
PNARSSPTRTDMPSKTIGHRWTPQNSHPPNKKKINNMSRTYIRDRQERNTLTAGHRQCDVLSRHDIKAERIDEVVDLHLLLLIFSSAGLGSGLDSVLSGDHLFGKPMVSIVALFGGVVLVCWSAIHLFVLRGAPRLLLIEHDEHPLN